MKNSFATVLVVFATFFNSPLLAQSGRPRRGDDQAAKYDWGFDLQEGKSRAKAAGKPLMVVLRCVP
jgi:hypothetical protein